MAIGVEYRGESHCMSLSHLATGDNALRGTNHHSVEQVLEVIVFSNFFGELCTEFI